jgi:Zn-dependent alcohol dehydrogenase
LQDFTLWTKNLVGTAFGSCNPRADIAQRYQYGQLQLNAITTRPYRLDCIRYADLLDGEIIRSVNDFELG